MEFKLPFGQKSEFRITSDDVIELTEKGKEAAEEQIYGGAKGQVLIRLDSGACSIKDLSRYTGLNMDMVKNAVVSLLNRGEAAKLGRGY